MPFELGLVIGWLQSSGKSNHTWFLFEAVTRRVSKSLSDLDGTDPPLQGNTLNLVVHSLMSVANPQLRPTSR